MGSRLCWAVRSRVVEALAGTKLVYDGRHLGRFAHALLATDRIIHVQAHKSAKEERLLSVSKAFDQGLSRHHLSGWDSILDQNVILHKDSITLYDDLHGLSTVKGYFQVGLAASPF